MVILVKQGWRFASVPSRGHKYISLGLLDVTMIPLLELINQLNRLHTRSCPNAAGDKFLRASQRTALTRFGTMGLPLGKWTVTESSVVFDLRSWTVWRLHIILSFHCWRKAFLPRILGRGKRLFIVSFDGGETDGMSYENCKTSDRL